MGGTVDKASARTTGMADELMSSAPTTVAESATHTGIAATTTGAIPTTGMHRRITINRPTTAGLTILGHSLSTTTGAGVDRHGTDITVPTTNHIRCIRMPRFG